MTTLSSRRRARCLPSCRQLLEYADADWSWNHGLEPYQVLSYRRRTSAATSSSRSTGLARAHAALRVGLDQCAKTLLLRLHAQLCLPKEVSSRRTTASSRFTFRARRVSGAVGAEQPTRLRMMEKPGAFIGFCDASKAYAGHTRVGERDEADAYDGGRARRLPAFSTSSMKTPTPSTSSSPPSTGRWSSRSKWGWRPARRSG